MLGSATPSLTHEINTGEQDLPGIRPSIAA
jgi:hypothetical protein